MGARGTGLGQEQQQLWPRCLPRREDPSPGPSSGISSRIPFLPPCAHSSPSRESRPPPGREGCRLEEARGLGRDGEPSLLPATAAPVSSGAAGSVGAEGDSGLWSPPAAGLGAMEQVQMINIQRLLEAAEYLERRERGNGRRRGAGITGSS